MNQLRVAIAQVAPIYLDLQASVDRACDAIDEAARGGAKLVAFAETWFTGYPAWLDHSPSAAAWGNPVTQKVFRRLRENSLTVNGPEVARLARLSAERDIVIVTSANERVETGPGVGTLYNALLIFAGGALVMHHRKLVPTYTERLVWGPGDGRGLAAVSTGIGRVGGLICWEHWMPLARQAMHECGEQIHIAQWPTVHDTHLMASRHYAFEGRCFVLACGLIMRGRDLPPELEHNEDPDALLIRGGSTIIGPDGQLVVPQVFDQEAIVYADLDLGRIDEQRMTLDVTGHYQRPDLFDFAVHRRTEPDPD